MAKKTAKKATAKVTAKKGPKPKVRARELAATLAAEGMDAALTHSMEPESFAHYCAVVAVAVSDMNETTIRAELRDTLEE